MLKFGTKVNNYTIDKTYWNIFGSLVQIRSLLKQKTMKIIA